MQKTYFLLFYCKYITFSCNTIYKFDKESIDLTIDKKHKKRVIPLTKPLIYGYFVITTNKYANS